MDDSGNTDETDFFEDPRILAAERRHSRRRKRARRIYDAVDWIFYASILVVAFFAFKLFLGFVTPYLLWF
jgi:hypothetical protein